MTIHNCLVCGCPGETNGATDMTEEQIKVLIQQCIDDNGGVGGGGGIEGSLADNEDGSATLVLDGETCKLSYLSSTIDCANGAAVWTQTNLKTEEILTRKFKPEMVMEKAFVGYVPRIVEPDTETGPLEDTLLCAEIVVPDCGGVVRMDYHSSYSVPAGSEADRVQFTTEFNVDGGAWTNIATGGVNSLSWQGTTTETLNEWNSHDVDETSTLAAGSHTICVRSKLTVNELNAGRIDKNAGTLYVSTWKMVCCE